MDHYMVHFSEQPATGLDDDVQISVTDAKGQLTELVRRAEAGDEIILTRHGHAAVRLVPVKGVPRPEARRKLLEAARLSGAAKATDGPQAARSQDFLYGEDGLPE
jgi:prevent-host-death family protein